MHCELRHRDGEETDETSRFLEESAHFDEALGGNEDPQSFGDLAGQLGRGIERVANVELLLLDALERGLLLATAQFRRGGFGAAEEIIELADAKSLRLARSDQLLIGVVPDGFEDEVAGAVAGGFLGVDQRLVDELREEIDDLESLDALARADAFDGLQRASSRED